MKWTKEPPTEPGWYWWRSNPTDPYTMPVFEQKDSGTAGGEWWPEKIEPPNGE